MFAKLTNHIFGKSALKRVAGRPQIQIQAPAQAPTQAPVQAPAKAAHTQTMRGALALQSTTKSSRSSQAETYTKLPALSSISESSTIPTEYDTQVQSTTTQSIKVWTNREAYYQPQALSKQASISWLRLQAFLESHSEAELKKMDKTFGSSFQDNTEVEIPEHTIELNELEYEYR